MDNNNKQVNKETSEPTATEPKETEPKDTDPKDTDPKDTDPKDSDSKDTEPKDTELKTKKLDFLDEVTLDDLLVHLGSMGRYQKHIFILMLPCAYFFAFLFFVQMFIVATPENFWCKIPELSHLSLEVRRNLSLPGAGTDETENCMTYDVNWADVATSMTPPPPTTPLVPCEHGWEFEFSDITYPTVVTERGWVCDESANVPKAQAIFFIGAIIGSIFFGWFADRYGRVPALVCVHVVGGIGGIATSYTTGVWDFMACRFITGLCFDNIFYMMFILALEYVGPDYRTCVASMSVALFFGSGCFVLLILAIAIRNWRTLLWVTSAPMLLAILLPWHLPESIRWLISRGQIKNAVKIIRKFEKINKRKVPDEVMDNFVDYSYHAETPKEKLSDMFKNVPMRLTIIIMLIVYMSCAVTYDTLVRLSESIGLNFFSTFAIMSTTEIPSMMLVAFMLDRYGRRMTASLTMAAASVLCIVAIFLSRGISQAVTAAMARFFVNMSWNTAAQWSTELLPTTLRATCSSGLHLSGHVISVFSPYIAYSERLWTPLPLLVIGITVFVGGIAAGLLPETNGLPMPLTIPNSEDIVVQHTFWARRYQSGRAVRRSRVSRVSRTDVNRVTISESTPEDPEDKKTEEPDKNKPVLKE